MSKLPFDHTLINKAQIAKKLGVSRQYIHQVIKKKTKGSAAEETLKKIKSFFSNKAA